MSNEPALRLDVGDLAPREYTIAELAALHGVSYRTLRFYEEKGLLSPARRGARRVFCDGDRVRLDLIMLAKRLGFALSEVGDLIASRRTAYSMAPSGRPSVASLGLSKADIAARVERLKRERAELQQAIDELRRAAPACVASTETSMPR